MMMKNKVGNIVMYLMVFVLVACTSSDQKDEIAKQGVRIKKVEYHQNDSLSKYLTADISVFLIEGNSPFADSVNTLILSAYISRGESIPENVNTFFDAYYQSQAQEVKEFIEDFEETNFIPYTFKYAAEVFENTDSVFSFEKSFYQYTGGAHGNGGKHFWNFDPNTGAEIRLEDLFSKNELSKLVELGELSFRKTRKIHKDKNLKDLGYEFDDGFSLTGNFLITNMGLVFYCAPYEIGPYAFGDTEFTISLASIKKIAPKSKLFGYVK